MNHTNPTEQDLSTTGHEQVCNDRTAWISFIRIFLLSMGIGFTVAGIVFFFAYNWADLHKFIKFGLISTLLCLTSLLSLKSRFTETARNSILTGASVLIGVLFAVYGQVYQTGANAYDFFLGWTLFSTIWVLISGFPPLWVLFLTLINTTVFLYSEQVANHWSELLVFTLLFSVNLLTLVFTKLLKRKGKTIPVWFTNLVAMATISFSTIGIIIGIIRSQEPGFGLLLLLAAVTYAAGIWYGLLHHSIFYLSIISLSLIILLSTWFMNISNEAGSFLIISLFIIGSATLTIKFLLDLQKKWTHEQQ
ncbi:DUF2157 domain-containing protein [Flavihumibacter sp. UBA7668]|uniref:DUF2157 domain-containing protein n=1 Tax=Flavihumibacter sp. UBA7668 TaxID=1946542 RepID=UPI0025B8F260|nr:DUF2157 domain-containing protein [Flavihumibacter sp. UBA7668]